MWALLRHGINLEGCTTPEELYRRAQKPWDEISIATVNALIASFPNRFRGVETLDGECLNGHGSLIGELQRGERTPQQIVQANRDERTAIEVFLRESRDFFKHFAENWREERNFEKFATFSWWIVPRLPMTTLIATKIQDHYPSCVRV
jgi:hypothetical protein